jgi:hypothetical protein
VLQISTVRQAAIAIVHPFPYTTDLIAVVDALAEEEGEPSGEAFKAAADACEAAPVQGMMQRIYCWAQSMRLITLHAQVLAAAAKCQGRVQDYSMCIKLLAVALLGF